MSKLRDESSRMSDFPKGSVGRYPTNPVIDFTENIQPVPAAVPATATTTGALSNSSLSLNTSTAGEGLGGNSVSSDHLPPSSSTATATSDESVSGSQNAKVTTGALVVRVKLRRTPRSRYVELSSACAQPRVVGILTTHRRRCSKPTKALRPLHRWVARFPSVMTRAKRIRELFRELLGPRKRACSAKQRRQGIRTCRAPRKE